MSGPALFDIIVWAWIALAIVLMPAQILITVPYGRHIRPGWGPTVPARLGWMAMEGVSPLVFGTLFVFGSTQKTGPMWVFFAAWIAHYINRSLIYPLRARMTGRRMPAAIFAGGILFNTINGGLNGLFLGSLSAPYPADWLADPRFHIGLAVFLIGAAINHRADDRLLALRKPGGPDYSIPRGGLFRYVSCPNHFGEIIEWCGFAMMCWNLPALGFAVWSVSNLIPRSLAHHRWYSERFPDYPANRKALIPFVL
jgi:hypothetical protein